MKTTLSALLLICLVSLTACSDSAIVINDLSKPMERTVISEKKDPFNYRLWLKGEADGSYQVNRIDLPKGKVDTSFLIDWYADTLVIKYEPGTAKKGHLRIRYSF